MKLKTSIVINLNQKSYIINYERGEHRRTYFYNEFKFKQLDSYKRVSRAGDPPLISIAERLKEINK